MNSSTHARYGQRPDLPKPQETQRLEALISLFVPLADRTVNGDKLASIGEGRFNLDVVNHFWNPIHNLRAREYLRSGLHEGGHALAVAGTLQNKVGNQRHRLRMI